MIKVLIIDDHALFREGIKKILSDVSDISAADEAGNGQEALDMAAENDYDVILLDISMSGRNSLEVLKQLKNDRTDQHILLVSTHPDEEYAERALRAGADGYLEKQSTSTELVDAIRKLSSGKKYISPSLAERLASHIGPDFKQLPHETLSDREYEVMCMIASGMTLTEIARDLSLSKKTISTHRTHILEKMGMGNNSQLIHYAVQNNLVE